MNGPMITRFGICSMQVCVPAEFTDIQVEGFANTENPSGISTDWKIRREEDIRYDGHDYHERVECADAERQGCVHLVLDC